MDNKKRNFEDEWLRAETELATTKNELTSLMAQFNWQSEQDAEAVRERDEEIASLKALVREMGKVLKPLERFVGLLAGRDGCQWTKGDMIDLHVKIQETLSRPLVKAIMEEKP